MEEKFSQKIRQYRRQKNITLKELGEKAQLSIGFLSQIERGLASMTIVSLGRIAEALGVNIRDLVDVNEKPDFGFVSRKDNQLLQQLEKSYYSYSRLSGSFEGRSMEAIMLTLLPQTLDSEETSHEGEEFYYVVKGKAVFIIQDKEYAVEEGESIHFPSHLRHKMVNSEDQYLITLCLVTPPLF